MTYPRLVRSAEGQHQAPEPLGKETGGGLVSGLVCAVVMVLFFVCEKLAMLFGYDPDKGEID